MTTTRIVEPCVFRILDIPVTDDVAAIDRARRKLLDRNRWLEISPNPLYRQKYKDLVVAGVVLVDAKQEAKRRQIIEFHTNGFAKFVSNFVSALQGDITQENYDFLIAEGQAPAHHLSPELAERLTAEFLGKCNIKVRGSSVG